MRIRWREERGQAAVESALVIPTMLFVMLGVLQMTLAYHARLFAEYAAFKAARSGSVYRGACRDRMLPAALAALMPMVNRWPIQDSLEQTAAHAWNQLEGGPGNGPNFNRTPAHTPIVMIDSRLDPPMQGSFDRPLAPQGAPTQIEVRIAYFFRLRIPFANWIISKFWLAAHTGLSWANRDPLLVMKSANQPPVQSSGAWMQTVLDVAHQNIQHDYYTLPIVTSWSMRMMSDPLPGEPGDCK